MNRWVVEMQDYRFWVEYRPGRKNLVADQLSRPVRLIYQHTIDSYLGLTLITQFIIHEGLLYLSADKHDNSIQLKLVVPQDMRKVALKLGHEKASGHLGRRKTIDCLESYFYWPSLRSDVNKYVKGCVACQRHKEGRAL